MLLQLIVFNLYGHQVRFPLLFSHHRGLFIDVEDGLSPEYLDVQSKLDVSSDETEADVTRMKRGNPSMNKFYLL